MAVLKDIYRFINCLSLVDIIFLVAITALLILLITLVYFIKINKDVLNEDDFLPPSDKKNDENIVLIEDNNQRINDVIEKVSAPVIEEYNDEEGELIDLETLTQKLQNEQSEERINCTEYEKDQEEKAIISYEELLQKRNKYAINYEKEEIIDDLIVKKVNLNDLVNKNEEEVVNEEVRVISYQKEEDFLSALKELNSLLN